VISTTQAPVAAAASNTSRTIWNPFARPLFGIDPSARACSVGGNEGMPPNKQCPSFSSAASVMPPSHDLTKEPTRCFGSVQQLLHCQGESTLALTKNEPGRKEKILIMQMSILFFCEQCQYYFKRKATYTLILFV
jgi:hypothetical protein